MIRVAAVGDVHVGADVRAFADVSTEHLAASADVLLLAGDLTQHGSLDEATLLAQELSGVPLPVVAVLGNHDYHQGRQHQIRGALEAVGVSVLEGEGVVLTISGVRLGIAGVKGFGGGFLGACGSEFGEDEMKAFMQHSRLTAERLEAALNQLDCEVRVALTHYSPVPGTLTGERQEIYPFLGSYLLGEAIDKCACAAAFHGHAHAGSERSLTPGGVPVRNVARPVIKLAYKTYTIRSSPGELEATGSEAAP